MNIFEFKTRGHHEYIDLEAVQVISGLKYKEEDYAVDTSYGPGSTVHGGRSEGSFSLLLVLRKERMTFEHQGRKQDYSSDFEQKMLKELSLAEGKPSQCRFAGDPPNKLWYFLERRSPEAQKWADYLNAMPEPFLSGRTFKAEYERLVDAWHKCPSRKYTPETAAA